MIVSRLRVTLALLTSVFARVSGTMPPPTAVTRKLEAALGDALSAESRRRVQFTDEAIARPFPLDAKAQSIDKEAQEAVNWIAARSVEEVRMHRESVT